MKKIISILKNKYYFKFLLHIIIFSALAIGIFYIDKNIQNTSYNLTFAFKQSFLKSFLMMMIAGIITIVTITFSTIMVVLTLYSGQFSPRTLNDFLQRKVPLHILGYFIGVSIYSLIGLILSENYPNYLFSNLTLFAMFLFLTGIILFAYYIHYVSKSVQINIYIDKLVKEAVNDIEKYQEDIKENETVHLAQEKKKTSDESFDNEYKIDKTGYFIDINTKKLIPYLKENNVSITVIKPYNEHIFEDDILFKYNSKKANFSFDEEIIKDCFIFSNEIGNYSEYRNRTMKLVEIAIRALSPGVNDPVTARNCIDQLGYIFMKLSDAHLSLHYYDEESNERLTIKTLNYDVLLYDHFYQIYLYGKQDLMILSSMIKAFTRISNDSNNDMKNSLWEFAKYILKDLNLKELHKFDFKEINYELKELAIKVNKHSEYKKLIERE
ncbi:MAG: DUF2254 domain-containing protein [Candidatus Izimaplasma sp.]|nr:DUF2254 domain-containing protein [Candidatus Izimaplasma bacterium]